MIQKLRLVSNPTIRVAAAVMLAAVVLAVQSHAGETAPAASAFPVDELIVETASGPRTFTVEVAANDADRAQGLMHRQDMAADEGMLFVFDGMGERFFWMKNTPLALDIIFISDRGVITHIADNTVPYSERVIPSMGPAQYVLEILAGTSAAIGIKPGDRVRSEAME